MSVLPINTKFNNTFYKLQNYQTANSNDIQQPTEAEFRLYGFQDLCEDKEQGRRCCDAMRSSRKLVTKSYSELLLGCPKWDPKSSYIELLLFIGIQLLYDLSATYLGRANLKLMGKSVRSVYRPVQRKEHSQLLQHKGWSFGVSSATLIRQWPLICRRKTRGRTECKCHCEGDI